MSPADHQDFDDLLDLGIVTAFGMSAARGGAAVAPAPMAAPQAESLGDLPQRVGKYDMVALIAQGGMGVVLRARDRELEREVAIKFLRRSLSANPAVQRLFEAEARVMGALQHPGIVPVYDFGRTPEGRLYYVMKLVGGESLQETLRRLHARDAAGAERGDRTKERRQLLNVFARVCETMAFAHDRGVVHGDLKPANVMVGTFGEVQIFDWGFARAAQLATQKPANSDDTSAPRILGTPAYMAPEQARGATETVGARTDVFALGGVLCEILTGAPPYRGNTREEVYLRACRAWLDDAHRRLDACGADQELVVLAHRCLAVDPAMRPADAGVVATAAHDHLAALEQRARTLAIAAAEANARAAEERKARRVTLLLSSAVIVALAIGLATFVWYEGRERATRADAEARASTALAGLLEARDRARHSQDVRAASDVGGHRHQASASGHATLWSEATVAAQAVAQLAGAPHLSEASRARLQQVHREVESEARVALRDERVSRLLEEIRPHQGEDRSAREIDDDHRALFAVFGVDIENDADDKIVQAVAGSALAPQIAAELHHWAHAHRPSAGSAAAARKPVEASATKAADAARATRLLALADRIDPDAWRTRMREVCVSGDLAALRALADAPVPDDVGAAGLGMLAECLAAAGERTAAARMYRMAHLLRPDDYNLTHDFAVLLGHMQPAPHVEIARLFTAAVALRPHSAHAFVDLATALVQAGDCDGATTATDRALALDADYARAHIVAAILAERKGDTADLLVHAARAAALRPRSALVQVIHVNALRATGDVEGALQVCEAAFVHTPESIDVMRGLIVLRNDLGFCAEAIELGRKAVAQHPDDALAWYDLGVVLQHVGDNNGAEAAYRRVLALDPGYAQAHCNLGAVLEEQGRFTEALVALRAGADLGSRQANWNYPTAEWIARAEKLAEHALEFDAMVAGAPAPEDGETLLWLARVALARGAAAHAHALFERACEMVPSARAAAQDRRVRAAARMSAASDVDAEQRAQARAYVIRALSSGVDQVEQALAAAQATPATARGVLARWLLLPDLAPLRELEGEAARGAHLAAEEHAALQQLWQRVRTLDASLRAKK